MTSATLTPPVSSSRAEVLPHPGRLLSEEEFEAWINEKTRAEWVDGTVVIMAPDNLFHSRKNHFLGMLLDLFVTRKKLGDVFTPNVQVRLGAQRRRRIPDVCFVSRKNSAAITETYIDGAPDLVVEIVSPESESRDWREKFYEYEAAGVREYWIVDPASQRVEIYALDRKAKYQMQPEKDGKIASKVLKGFYLRPAWLWQKPEPDVIAILKELGAL
jgi:Uma2 family endonuclease